MKRPLHTWPVLLVQLIVSESDLSLDEPIHSIVIRKSSIRSPILSVIHLFP